MLKSEFHKLRKLKLTYLVALGLIAVGIYDAIMTQHSFFESSPVEWHFLLAAQNQGHLAAIILFWLFPIYYFVLIGELNLREHARAVTPVILTRVTRTAYLRTKWA